MIDQASSHHVMLIPSVMQSVMLNIVRIISHETIVRTLLNIEWYSSEQSAKMVSIAIVEGPLHELLVSVLEDYVVELSTVAPEDDAIQVTSTDNVSPSVEAIQHIF